MMSDPLNPHLVRDEMLIRANEPPKPFHPQQKFGSGVQAAALAYPHLAAYYGEAFNANFTTLDLLDSLAARVHLLEEEIRIAKESAAMADAISSFGQNISAMLAGAGAPMSAPVKPAKLPWRTRLLLRLMGRLGPK